MPGIITSLTTASNAPPWNMLAAAAPSVAAHAK